MQEFLREHWGDTASVLGLLASVVGLFIAWLAFRAAKDAESAAREAKERLSRYDTLEDCSQVTAILEEIKRHHRTEAWAILPDRYATVRRLLIGIRSANATISDEDNAALTNAIQRFLDVEKRIESANTRGKGWPGADKSNSLVSEEIDKLAAVFARLRRSVRQ